MSVSDTDENVEQIQHSYCWWEYKMVILLWKAVWEFLIVLNWEGNDIPLQYSCLESPMDRGAWWATVHGVAKSQTQLSDLSLFTFTHWRRKWQPTPQCSCLENPRDGGAWWAAVSGVTQSRIRLKWLSSSSSSIVLNVDISYDLLISF